MTQITDLIKEADILLKEYGVAGCDLEELTRKETDLRNRIRDFMFGYGRLAGRTTLIEKIEDIQKARERKMESRVRSESRFNKKK